MKNRYRDYGLEIPTEYKIPSTRERGESIIEIGLINIDRDCWQKTPYEKLKRKIEKICAKANPVLNVAW